MKSLFANHLYLRFVLKSCPIRKTGTSKLARYLEKMLDTFVWSRVSFSKSLCKSKEICEENQKKNLCEIILTYVDESPDCQARNGLDTYEMERSHDPDDKYWKLMEAMEIIARHKCRIRAAKNNKTSDFDIFRLGRSDCVPRIKFYPSKSTQLAILIRVVADAMLLLCDPRMNFHKILLTNFCKRVLIDKVKDPMGHNVTENIGEVSTVMADCFATFRKYLNDGVNGSTKYSECTVKTKLDMLGYAMLKTVGVYCTFPLLENSWFTWSERKNFDEFDMKDMYQDWKSIFHTEPTDDQRYAVRSAEAVLSIIQYLVM